MGMAASGAGFTRQAGSSGGGLGPLVPWAGNLLLVAMVVALGWQLGRLSWHLAWQQAPLTNLYQGGSAASQPDANPSIRLDQLDLFGVAKTDAPVPEAIGATAPKTNLQLVLQGVVVAGQARESGAIVADSQGNGKYYKIGDTLPGRAKLIAVESHRILLRRNGHVEALPFVDRENAAASAGQGGITANASPGQVFQQASAELAKDPRGALGSVGLKPAASGQASGYVYNGSNPMLNALSLKKGDVILSINGHDLGEIQRDRQMMAQWYRSGQLQIEVERNGTQFTINVPIPH